MKQVQGFWIAFPLKGCASTMFVMTYWMRGEKNDKPLNTHSGHECLGKISRPPFQGEVQGLADIWLKGRRCLPALRVQTYWPLPLAVTCLLFRGLRPSVWRQW